VYTILDNNSSTTIADSNRRKDIEIANISRVSEFETAQANRLNEMLIAEKSREKDRELALEQQRQNVLLEYQTFLAKLLLEGDAALKKPVTAQLVCRFMTVTALSQLDAPRKSIVLRALSETRLINLEVNSKPDDKSILELERVDLRDTTFNLYRYASEEQADLQYNLWSYLWLPATILKNASFRYVFLDCSTFERSLMDSADFSFAAIRTLICFQKDRTRPTDFSSTSLVNANFFRAAFTHTDFSHANLTLANMRHFYCRDCRFSSAILVQVDLSFVTFTALLTNGTATFLSTELRQIVAHSAAFRVVNFTSSRWTNVQALNTVLWRCTFPNVTMRDCAFLNCTIQESTFRYANLYGIDISGSTLFNVSFTDSDMRGANFSFIHCNYCRFANVELYEAIFTSASFRNSNFLSSSMNTNQLMEEAIDLTGTTLSNGTIVPKNQKNCSISSGFVFHYRTHLHQ
jgi:uncharacterized protein YjbI with pentapeptide repeats